MPRSLRATVWFCGVFAVLFVALAVASALADAPRVMPTGTLPPDRRLGELKDLDGYFPFEVSSTPEAWKKRAEHVRRQVLVATGLWPMPAKTPLHAVVHGRVERDDFTVDRVYFESYPGLFVTGSLFKPKNKPGPYPVVLCPHGHWANGRFYATALKDARWQLADGAERFESAALYPLQARCVQLARMGCMVFHYDMIGNADSQQLPAKLSHGYADKRPAMETPENWGLFSPQAELRMQSIMGLQTYDSIRALDFMLEQPDADKTRVGITGASGGGTQTFIASAIDPRITVEVPAVMVSTAMQGGCTCENCSYLRVDTGNIEFAGLFAPKPLAMIAANDWTKEIMTKGYPELERLYAMLNAKDNVTARALVQFPHNYNHVSRATMYRWMNKQLKLGLEEPVLESDFKPLTQAELTVWDDKHPAPPGGDDFERKLVKTITEGANQQIAALKPTDSASLAKFREVVGGAVDVLVGRKLPAADTIAVVQVGEKDHGGYVERTSLVHNAARGEAIPTIMLAPKKWNKHVVIWADENGKAGLYGSDGGPRPEVQRLLTAGTMVVGADLFDQGEFLPAGAAAPQNRTVTNPRQFAGYTYGYNYPLAIQRSHDLLTLVAMVRSRPEKPEQVSLIALGKAGVWGAFARAQESNAIDKAAIDTAGFRFAKLTDFTDAQFVPGIVKYGDFPALLALNAPKPLFVAGEGQTPALASSAYAAAGQAASLVAYQGPAENRANAAVDFMLK